VACHSDTQWHTLSCSLVVSFFGVFWLISRKCFIGTTCAVFQFRIFTAPFHFVNFADFWLADQLNSLSCVLLDIEFLICYYAVEVDWLGADSKYSLVHSICSDIFGTNVSRLQQI